jgi:hypothetical protein
MNNAELILAKILLVGIILTTESDEQTAYILMKAKVSYALTVNKEVETRLEGLITTMLDSIKTEFKGDE